MSGREFVLVGTIGRPHGLRGEASVRLLTDDPERRFAVGASVKVGVQTRKVERVRWHQGFLLVTFAGVADRNTAQSLQGLQVWAEVDVEEVPLADGEFYDRHLIGLSVRDAKSAPVGTVVEVLHLPAQECLMIEVDGARRMVPFVSQLVPVVDLHGGFLQVADLPGLLEDLP